LKLARLLAARVPPAKLQPIFRTLPTRTLILAT
jgi:hypothetical protein